MQIKLKSCIVDSFLHKTPAKLSQFFKSKKVFENKPKSLTSVISMSKGYIANFTPNFQLRSIE